ncbi:MAG: hypothetical protein LQ338_007769, partial [Usnochroma carphineum]
MYLTRWFLPLAAGLSQLAHSQETALRSGNYILRYCGNDTASKGWQLGSLLLRFRSDLQLVLTDVRRGTASKAYRAFFKSQKNAAFVQDIFRKIAIGNSIQVSINGVVHTHAPTIVCPDPAIPLYDELIRNCGTTIAAVHLTGRELVYLCPRFWDLDEQPVQALCPRVRWNKFTSNKLTMVANMFGAFVHEFAHVYLQDLEAPKETYGLMDAVELSAKASLRNANNYALYAA